MRKKMVVTAFWCWRLVLEYYERKLLLTGSCWRLMLECYERKILLADAGAEQRNRVKIYWSYFQLE